MKKNKKKNDIPESLMEILRETSARTRRTYPIFEDIMRNMKNKTDIPFSVQVRKDVL